MKVLSFTKKIQLFSKIDFDIVKHCYLHLEENPFITFLDNYIIGSSDEYTYDILLKNIKHLKIKYKNID